MARMGHARIFDKSKATMNLFVMSSGEDDQVENMPGEDGNTHQTLFFQTKFVSWNDDFDAPKPDEVLPRRANKLARTSSIRLFQVLHPPPKVDVVKKLENIYEDSDSVRPRRPNGVIVGPKNRVLTRTGRLLRSDTVSTVDLFRRSLSKSPCKEFNGRTFTISDVTALTVLGLN